MNWVSAIKYDFAPEWRANTFNGWNSLRPHNLSFLKHNNDFSWEMQWILGSWAIDLSCIQSNKSSPTSHPGPICLIQRLSPYRSISLERIYSIQGAIHWQGIINPVAWRLSKITFCCYSALLPTPQKVPRSDVYWWTVTVTATIWTKLTLFWGFKRCKKKNPKTKQTNTAFQCNHKLWHAVWLMCMSLWKLILLKLEWGHWQRERRKCEGANSRLTK